MTFDLAQSFAGLGCKLGESKSGILQELHAFDAEQFLWDTESGLASANPAHRKKLAGKILFHINFLLIRGTIVFRINLV